MIPTEGDTSECVVLNCIQNLRNVLGSAQKIQGGVTFHRSLGRGWRVVMDPLKFI